MIPEKKTNYTAEAISRMLWQFSQSPKLQGWVASISNRYQEIENGLWEVINKRLLDNAIGAQLDVLGKIVGRPRGTLDDTNYIIAIRAQILINRSSGTANELEKIGQLSLPGPYFLRFRDMLEATIQIDLEPTVTGGFDPNNVFDILVSAKAGGVRMLFGYALSENRFTFRNGSSTSTTKGFSDYNDPQNGHLRSVYSA